MKTISEDIGRILRASHHDPFACLGWHEDKEASVIRAYLPHAIEAWVGEGKYPMESVSEAPGIFEYQGKANHLSTHPILHWKETSGELISRHDPYSFPPQLNEFDIQLIGTGNHWHAYRILGAHAREVDGIHGILFAVWAPNAERVSVIGEFNHWDGRCHPMRVRGGSGIWELFIPDLAPGHLYKFELRNRHTGHVLTKIDPYARQFERRPQTACITVKPDTYKWHDEEWILKRNTRDWLHTPMSIYEIHLGSWQRDENGLFLDYRTLAHKIADYVLDLGFTHIELLPITEHPLDASWGYQTTGYFAPTSRFGTPDEFRYFVDYLHQSGIGVLLDWVPAHFPRDEHALARFDGTPLYEHADPRLGEHRDWGTYIFNYGRNEVRNFLISSAMFWVEEFHIDGLRVDAVASMLYLNYSRSPDDWVPNKFGGNENIEAIDFIRQLNSIVQGNHPGVLITAEESTAWPQVTRPPDLGGLGFSMKWNMGWMHDTLDYFSKDPIHRHYHHDRLTFGLLYAFTENFVLPFSHDEVVHGKRSLLYRMPGDEWQRFANLRLLMALLFSYPGKKLLFMGCEFGQGSEWNFDAQLDWYVTEYSYHQGVRLLVKDLNQVYRGYPALHDFDFEQNGFEWIDCHDAPQSIISFFRKGRDGSHLIIVCNFTPVPRTLYRIGTFHNGQYRERLNSDSTYYGGSNVGNPPVINSEMIPWMGLNYSINVQLPPLGLLILEPVD